MAKNSETIKKNRDLKEVKNIIMMNFQGTLNDDEDSIRVIIPREKVITSPEFERIAPVSFHYLGPDSLFLTLSFYTKEPDKHGFTKMVGSLYLTKSKARELFLLLQDRLKRKRCLFCQCYYKPGKGNRQKYCSVNCRNKAFYHRNKRMKI